ncbi:unnamed protein product [Cuscuta epithymum]|uniref:Uncharacterized protein n=1 Tax=Cuscuta epithymum TaxID=186058 RepID=A0AAV0G193_9ASTE|nr:unnamed protein product [Cuscuta epithymum]
MAFEAGLLDWGVGMVAGGFIRQCENCFYMVPENLLRAVVCVNREICVRCYAMFDLDLLIDEAPPTPTLPSQAVLSRDYEDPVLGWFFETVGESSGAAMGTPPAVVSDDVVLRRWAMFDLNLPNDEAPLTPTLPSPAVLSPDYEDPDLGWFFETVGQSSGAVPGTPPAIVSDGVALRRSTRRICLNRRYFNGQFVVDFEFGWLAS